MARLWLELRCWLYRDLQGVVKIVLSIVLEKIEILKSLGTKSRNRAMSLMFLVRVKHANLMKIGGTQTICLVSLDILDS